MSALASATDPDREYRSFSRYLGSAGGNSWSVGTSDHAAARASRSRARDAARRTRWLAKFQELLHQRDPRRLLELEARHDRMICERVAPLHEAMRNAAATDDDIARLHATIKQQRHTGARIVAEALAALGPLRDDLDLDAATDLLWLLKDPALYTALVGDRGWPAERYQAWLARAMQASLLPARASRRNRAP